MDHEDLSSEVLESLGVEDAEEDEEDEEEDEEE